MWKNSNPGTAFIAFSALNTRTYSCVAEQASPIPVIFQHALKGLQGEGTGNSLY